MLKFTKLFLFSLLVICTQQTLPVFAQQEGEEEMEENGALRQKLFFETLHAPMVMPGADYYMELAKQISMMPKEGEGMKVQSVNSWEYCGADGVRINLGNTKLSGRITNFELRSSDNDQIKVVAASGGVWRYTGGPNLTAVSMSDQLTSLWGGAYASDPNDSMVAFFGTGEFGVHGGTGLYKTTDMGVTWTSVPMTPPTSSFSRIVYNPVNTQTIHAATWEGYYRSYDGGATWTRKFSFASSGVSDLVINHADTTILYLAYWDHGVYKSTNGGDTWVIQNNGIPVSNVGRTALSIGTVNPDVVYANMTNASNNATKGIYKTTNGGTTWTACLFGNDLSGTPSTGNIHSNQGWYNNVISISPVNDNIVLAGGVGMWRTIDGTTFNEIDARHADQHAVAWNQNGTEVFVGNDGGVFFSSNSGFSFATVNASKYNILPVSQYYHFSIGKSNPHVVGGTTQDNGFHFKSYATGGVWSCEGGGDGSGIAVDPLDSNIFIYGNGIFGAPLNSHRFLTLDAGINFTNADVNINACGDWFPELRISPTLGTYYTACDKDVYYSFNHGITWTIMNPANPFAANVADFTVSNDPLFDSNVYACLENGSVKVMVFDNQLFTWVNRSAGLPVNTYIRKVAVDLIDPDVGYALAGGLPTNGAGNKVFKTTDRGQTWVNISGNLPNVAVTDLLAYPGNSNLLYLGSESGCFKSIDGGQTWATWNNGMPTAPLVNEFDYIDSLATAGTFYVAACSYGRGMWIREVSGDDAVGIKETVKNQLFLSQNTDNPGTGLTKIIYANSDNGMVNLTFTDITGKLIAQPVNQYQPKGKHEVIFDRSKLKSGVYFYRLTCNGSTQTRKMLVTD